MPRLDKAYISIAFIWLLVGMVFGVLLGATDHLNYSNSHAHLNLLGFVVSTLFGLVHKLYPSLSTSRLAVPQFFIYQIGTASLILGKFLFDGGTRTPFLEGGSVITIVGTALMAVIFMQKSNA